MYTIYVDGNVLYSPNLVEENYVILEPKLTKELNKAGSLTFKLPLNNPMYDGIQKLKSIITVVQDGEEIFRGRVLHDEKDFYNMKNVYCEGELSFLLDSVQRPYNFKSLTYDDIGNTVMNIEQDFDGDGRVDVFDLFKMIMKNHNEQVDEWKRFEVGDINIVKHETLTVDGEAAFSLDADSYPILRTVTVESKDGDGMKYQYDGANSDDSSWSKKGNISNGTHNYDFDSDVFGIHTMTFTGYGTVTIDYTLGDLNIKNKEYSTTFDELTNRLINNYGGYLRTRLQDGVRYIDYVEDYGTTTQQTIEFGSNLLDITEYIDAENVFTVLIPLGYERDSGLRKTIEEAIVNVNGEEVVYGKDYIEDENAISLFGRINKTQTWDDVKTANDLYEKGVEFLKSGIEMAVTLTVKAVDLHLINVDTDKINLGDKVRVVSLPHKLDEYFLCSKITIDLVNVDKTEFVLGYTHTTMTEKQVSGTKTIQNTVNSAQSTADKAVEKVDNIVAKLPTDYITDSNLDEKLNQERIFNLLMNNGQSQSMLLNKETGDIYINASYIKSGTITLGGSNALLSVVNGDGTVCARVDEDGIHILEGEVNATSGSLKNMTIVNGINITSETNSSIQEKSMVSIQEYQDETFGKRVAITFGETDTDLRIAGNYVNIQGGLGIVFNADNIIFKNDIQAPSAYLDNVLAFSTGNSEKQVIFRTQTSSGTYTHDCKIYGGNSSSTIAIGLYDVQNGHRILVYDDQSQQLVTDLNKFYFGNSTNDQKNMYFYNTDSATYQHKCKLYGAEGDSTTAIGLFDVLNNRAIWVYDDVNNYIRSNTTLQSVVPEITLVDGASAVSNNSVAFSFLKMCFFRARLTLAKSVIANSGIVEIAELASTYAPESVSSSINVYVNQNDVCDASVRITTSGKIGIKSSTTINSGTQIYLMGCWRY